MPELQTTISPHNQQPFVIRTYPEERQLGTIIQNAKNSQRLWSRVPLKERIATGYKFAVSSCHCLPSLWKCLTM